MLLHIDDIPGRAITRSASCNLVATGDGVQSAGAKADPYELIKADSLVTICIQFLHGSAHVLPCDVLANQGVQQVLYLLDL